MISKKGIRSPYTAMVMIAALIFYFSIISTSLKFSEGRFFKRETKNTTYNESSNLASKEACEMSFWKYRKSQEGTLVNGHYQAIYTNYVGLNISHYENKRVLDVGCGPRGSLEWTPNSSLTVCVDPLANSYESLGVIGKHKMMYVQGGIESIPFVAESFDVVSSINNFDHVENPRKGAEEVSRVLKHGGKFLLITEIHTEPKPCEPQVLGWNVSDFFTAQGLVLEHEKRASLEGKYKGTHSILNEELPKTYIGDGFYLGVFKKL